MKLSSLAYRSACIWLTPLVRMQTKFACLVAKCKQSQILRCYEASDPE